MGDLIQPPNMVKISIIISLVLLACFVSANNQEKRDAALSDESLLGRVERHAGWRSRIKKTRGKKDKKRRKGRKKTRKTRGKNGNTVQRKQNCARQTGPDDATCLANIGTVMDYEGNQVGNFERQKKRIESFSTLMEKGGEEGELCQLHHLPRHCPGHRQELQ